MGVLPILTSRRVPPRARGPSAVFRLSSSRTTSAKFTIAFSIVSSRTLVWRVAMPIALANRVAYLSTCPNWKTRLASTMRKKGVSESMTTNCFLPRCFSVKLLGKKQFVVMDSLTPFFLMVEAKRVFQFGQVLKYATRFAKAIGIATLHTKVLDETIENAMVNFADVVLELERRKTPEGISRGGTLRLVKLGKTQIPSRGYYYEMTPQGIVISTAPPI